VHGYRALVVRAHAKGVRVVGTTLAPFADALPGTPLHASYYSRSKDALRLRLNDWIRRSGTFDAVVDFDAVLRDPARSHHLAPAYDSGDHLHPGDVGNRAMADAITLATLIKD
jgi:lysophospholipase L1-like esterase